MIISSLFSQKFDRKAFECGNQSLEGYLKFQASQDERNSIAACYILHEEGELQILGYYTLSSYSLLLDNIPEAHQKKLPKYPVVPATLLGRLAISSERQGQGIGKKLLIDGLLRAMRSAKAIGSWAVVVDPIDEAAERFYEKFGFRKFSADPQMLLAMKELRQNLPSKESAKSG